MKKFLEFMEKAFSESGVPSSKRVLGGIMIITLLVFTGYMIFSPQYSEYIKKDLINTQMIGAWSLVGVSAIMSKVGKGGTK